MSNAFPSCFWRNSLLYPTWWWCKLHFKTIAKIPLWYLWRATNTVIHACLLHQP